MAEIKYLPIDVAGRIEASSNITSLNRVVLGLLENALDADGKKISIRVDYARGMCCVEDNGNGICRADFQEGGGLGKAYHTSKVSADRDHLGSDGLFLSSVAALATLSIISRQRNSPDTNALILRYSETASRLIPAPQHMALELAEQGTKVSVYDLFGNMAVRVKQRPASRDQNVIRDKEWTSLCISVTGALLAYGRPLYIVMKGGEDNHRFRVDTSRVGLETVGPPSTRHFNSTLITSTLRHALDLDTTAEWVYTSARTSQMTIRALICLEPSASRKMQFICMVHRYMPPGELFEALYETASRHFWDSSFGIYDGPFRTTLPRRGLEANSAVVRTGKQRYGFERWPMFVIRVEPGSRGSRTISHQSKLVMTIRETLTAMTVGFLEELRFKTKILRSVTAPESEIVAQKTTTSIRNNDVSSSKSTLLAAFAKPDFHIRYPRHEANSPPIDANNPAFPSRFVSSKRLECDPVRDASQSLLVAKPSEKDLCTSKQRIESGIPQDYTGSKSQVKKPGSKALSAVLNGDEYIEWTDSYTTRKYHLNTRTGWTRALTCQSRPATSNDATVHSAIMRRDSSHRPRLTRSADGFARAEEGPWVQKILSTWETPVFESTEQPIRNQQIQAAEGERTSLFINSCCEENDSLDQTILTFDTKMSVSALKHARVIGQVDSKFILLRFPSSSNHDTDVLVLADQHASDERVKVEKLMQGLCSPPCANVQAYTSPLNQKSDINTVILEFPIYFDLSHREHSVFKRSAPYFAKWGILYDLTPSETRRSSDLARRNCRLAVLSLPECIAPRCKLETETLIEMMRTEAWKYEDGQVTQQFSQSAEIHHWTRRIQWCPQSILNLINSRACRSAIMFNDALNLAQCEQLISALAECRFPFQCAHGRPSMVPLMDIGSSKCGGNAYRDADDHDNFQSVMRRWMQDD